MVLTDRTKKLWFGTSDAPAPIGTISEGGDISITTGVSPVHPDNTVLIYYKINAEEEKQIGTEFLPDLSDPDKQYFSALLPPLHFGDVVKYKVCFYCNGQHFPSIENLNQTEVSFRITDSEVPPQCIHATEESLEQWPLKTSSDSVVTKTALNLLKSRVTKSSTLSQNRNVKNFSSFSRFLDKSKQKAPSIHINYNAYRIEASLPICHSALKHDIEQQLWVDNISQSSVNLSIDDHDIVEIALLDGQNVKYIRKNISDSSSTRRKIWVIDESGRQLCPENISNALLPIYNIHSIGSTDSGLNTTIYLADYSSQWPVIVCQGKPNTDALVKRGLLAVGTLNGSLRTPSEAALLPIAKRQVILWPNNSDVGIKHMQRIAQVLTRLGNNSIKMVAWNGAKRNTTSLQFNGNNKELQELLLNAPSWSAGTKINNYGVVGFSLPKTPLRMSIKKMDVTGSMRLVKPSFWKQNRKIRSIKRNIIPILMKINSNENISQEERLLLNHQFGLLEEMFGKKFVNQLITIANDEGN